LASGAAFFSICPIELKSLPNPLWQTNLSLSFTVGAIDDLGKNTFFGKINPFSSERAKVDKYRTIVTGFLPLKLTATSAPYDFYQRL
jgi:hypothetical protein